MGDQRVDIHLHDLGEVGDELAHPQHRLLDGGDIGLGLAAHAPAPALVTWMITFQFDGDVDYFELDPVAYAPALGELGMARYRRELAAVEAELQPGESLEAGCLYLSLPEAGEDPYLHIRGFFDRLGFRPLRGSLNEGLLYSCHPHGTMDGGFKLGLDLRQYAERLPQIRALGVDHIWLLPVFDHLDRGVYHPTDQRPIDARYGGEEAMRHFAQEAHALGMTVLPSRTNFLFATHPLVQARTLLAALRADGILVRHFQRPRLENFLRDPFEDRP